MLTLETLEIVEYADVPKDKLFDLPRLVDPTQTEAISKELSKHIQVLIKKMAEEMLLALTAEAKVKIERIDLEQELVEYQLGNVLRRISSAISNIRASLGLATRNLISNIVTKVYVKGSIRSEKDLKKAGVIDKKDTIPGSLIDDRITEALEDTINDLIDTIQTQFAANAKNVIRTGLLKGEPIASIREKLKLEANKASASINRTVRTEMVRTFNIASNTKFKQTGVQYIIWQASKARQRSGAIKSRTCENCFKLHNTVVPIGKPFGKIKGKEIRIPPDPHPNCLCTIKPVTIEQLTGMADLKIRSNKIRRLMREHASKRT